MTVVQGRSASLESRRTTWLVLGTLVVVAEALLLLDPRTGAMDLEEGLTPVAAHLLGWLPPTRWPTTLYRPFCGGCLVGSMVAAPTFAVLGDAVWAWKLTLLPYVAAWVGFGTLAARRIAGDAAARAHVLLCALAPPILAEASVRGWTNHFESTALALGVLAAAVRPDGPRRPWATGLLAGLSLWVSWTAIPTLAAAAWQLRTHRGAAVRVALAGAWVVLPLEWTWVATGEGPWALRGLATDAAVDVGGQLRALLDPVRAAQVLDAQGAPWRAVPGWAALLGGLAVASWRPGPGRLPALAIGVWLVGYLVGPARLLAATPPVLWSNRYLTPVLIHLALATAVAVGRLGPRAGVALVLAAAWPGASAQLRRATGELTTAHLAVPSPSWTWFRRQLLDRVPFAVDVPCPPGDAACADLVAYRRGWRVARGMASIRDGDADDVVFAAGWGAGIAAQSPDHLQVAPVAPELRVTAQAERLAVELSLVSTTEAVDVPSAWWLGLTRAEAVPVGSAEVRAAFAYGYGQRWTLDHDGAAHPALPGWTAELEPAFARGAAEARATPWMVVWRP